MGREAVFYSRAEAWLMRLMELNPVLGTQWGNHSWDDRLPRLSPQALQDQEREMRAALDEFAGMESDEFSLDARIDHELLVRIIAAMIRSRECMQPHLRNPGFYLDEALGGVLLLLLREFAPLPQRLESALGRAREVPRVLEEGQVNLVPQRVPPVWAQTALEQAELAPGLFGSLLPALCAKAAPELQKEMVQQGQRAVEAIEAYARFLNNDVLLQAGGSFAVGKDLFDEMLREEHMVDYDADELLEIGWQQFRHTQEQMKELARQIDPYRPARDLLEEAKADHPSAEGLLVAYEEAMDAARRYVREQDIVTIPEGEELRIVETPTYLRPIIPYAAYMPPGPLEERQEGIFIVTPVDPDAPPEDRENRLRGHYRAKLPVIALHEAYPGHHLQLVWANQQETTPRQLGSIFATLFIEGWAFYCEELMEQLGYIAEPLQRLGRLSGQLWRAGRIILDVSLHTRDMEVKEAVRFLVVDCQLEPGDALAEVRRYTQTPTQPQSYLMGKLAILDLVADYRRVHPDASLREVHDAILSCGSLPPRLMRQRLQG